MTIEDIKKYIKMNGISQIELADRSGVPLQTLRGIFSGRTLHPRIDTMQAIEKALGFNEKVQLTSEEIAAGISLTRKENLTPEEDDLLYAFRKLSPALRDVVIKTAYTLAGEDYSEATLHKKA